MFKALMKTKQKHWFSWDDKEKKNLFVISYWEQSNNLRKLCLTERKSNSNIKPVYFWSIFIIPISVLTMCKIIFQIFYNFLFSFRFCPMFSLCKQPVSFQDKKNFFPLNNNVFSFLIPFLTKNTSCFLYYF